MVRGPPVPKQSTLQSFSCKKKLVDNYDVAVNLNLYFKNGNRISNGVAMVPLHFQPIANLMTVRIFPARSKDFFMIDRILY